MYPPLYCVWRFEICVAGGTAIMFPDAREAVRGHARCAGNPRVIWNPHQGRAAIRDAHHW